MEKTIRRITLLLTVSAVASTVTALINIVNLFN